MTRLGSAKVTRQRVRRGAEIFQMNQHGLPVPVGSGFFYFPCGYPVVFPHYGIMPNRASCGGEDRRSTLGRRLIASLCCSLCEV